MSRLIRTDVLLEHIEHEFDGVCVYDVSRSEAISDFENIVDLTPSATIEDLKEAIGNVDYPWVKCENTDKNNLPEGEVLCSDGISSMVGYLNYQDDGEYQGWYCIEDGHILYGIIAWMPCPVYGVKTE